MGSHFQGKIEQIKPQVRVIILAKQTYKPDDKKVALGIGFIRPNRLEFVLEKCTELGVNNFYLYRSEHSNYFSANMGRYMKILRQAIKQSVRFYLPELMVFKEFDDFLNSTEKTALKVAAIDSRQTKIDLLEKGNDLLYCVGPEGGFSENEIKQMRDKNFNFVSLGEYRLRAETAAMAGIAKLKL